MPSPTTLLDPLTAPGEPNEDPNDQDHEHDLGDPGAMGPADDDDEDDDLDLDDAKELDLPELRRQHGELTSLTEAIVEREHAVREAESVMDQKKRELKEAKDGFEAAVASLRAGIRELEDARRGQGTLFVDLKPDAPPPLQSDESWKDLRLEAALPALSPTVISKLNAAQLYTMGDLVNRTAADGGRHRLTDIPGIGSAVSGKIEEATLSFWDRQGRQVLPMPAASDDHDSE